MRTERLSTLDGFVVFDLEGAETSLGVVRSAPKILVDGATWLARSQTYQFASFEVRAGGASAGVNAPGDQQRAAVGAFVAEITPWAAERRLLVAPGKGATEAELAPLRVVDGSGDALGARRPALAAAGVVAGLGAALGSSLEGRSVAAEVFDDVGVAVATAVVERGGRLAAVATPAGAFPVPDGADVLDGLRQHGTALPSELGWEAGPADDLLGVEADALVVGSRVGRIDHLAAPLVRAGAVVPSGPLPVTAKALAALGRAGVAVLPDFVTTAGPALVAVGAHGGADADAQLAWVAERVGAVLAEVVGSPAAEGSPVLAACHRAEAFLSTWQDELPFGRPLA